MAPKKTSAPASAPASKPSPKSPTAAPASSGKMRKGTGSARNTRRFFTIYGPPKNLKTTSCANLPLGRTKWIASDPNCIPCLTSLDRLPHPDDIYEIRTLAELRTFLEETLALAEAEGAEALGIDYLVLDSATQYSDWHQQVVAQETGQRYMGDNKDDNGWQQFNAQFGTILDLLAALTRYVTVIVIAHAKQKFDLKKGEYSGFSLSPAMAEKLGRLSNGVFYKTFTEVLDDDTTTMRRTTALKEKRDSPWYVFVEDPENPENDDSTKVYEAIFHTRPYNGWFASVEKGPLAPEEPGRDFMVLLEKLGLT